jgi:hypothetical protein
MVPGQVDDEDIETPSLKNVPFAGGAAELKS